MLQIAQVQALNDPSTHTFQEERDLHDKWTFLRHVEDSYFRQKSRINWLSEGDFNTTFFHRMCQVRASYNAIRSFLSVAGDMITDPVQMSELVVGHLKSILGPQNYCHPSLFSPCGWFVELVGFEITQQQREQMLSVPTAEEIRRLIFKLNPNKAPGPDGLTSGFFKASWETLGE